MCSNGLRGILFLMVGVPLLEAAPVPCLTTAPLTAYIALGSCTVGANLTFENFGFQLISSAGITLPIDASQITVTPDVSGMGLDFSSNSLFNLTASQSVELAVTYEVLAPGLTQMGSTLVSPVLTAQGSINLQENLCPGCVPNQGGCVLSATSVDLSDSNTASQLSGFASFASVSTVWVGDCFHFTGAAASIMNSPDNVQSTGPPSAPEPYSILLCFLGLLIVGWRLNWKRVVLSTIGEGSRDRSQDSCATLE
jgi:hypothetical protein